MSNYSKILGLGLFAVLVICLLFSFYKFYVVHDYMIYGHGECNPSVSVCFARACDADTEVCSDGIEYYTLIKKNASQIPPCDSHDEKCASLACIDDEKDCVVTFCSEEALLKEEGAYCSDPIEFIESGTELRVLNQESEPIVIKEGESGLVEEPLEVAPETTASTSDTEENSEMSVQLE